MTDIHWTGDLDDDCTAIWEGLCLRAECMGCDDEDCEGPETCGPDHGEFWWWAVSDNEGRIGGSQLMNCWGDGDLDGVGDGGGLLATSELARAAAEKAARRIVEG